MAQKIEDEARKGSVFDWFCKLPFKERGKIVFTYFLIMCCLYFIVPYIPGIYGSIYILWYWILISIVHILVLYFLSLKHWKGGEE